jgi:hypothetical protein
MASTEFPYPRCFRLNAQLWASGVAQVVEHLSKQVLTLPPASRTDTQPSTLWPLSQTKYKTTFNKFFLQISLVLVGSEYYDIPELET